MSRFWLAVAKFSAKRAGGRFIRRIDVGGHPLWPNRMPDLFDLDDVIAEFGIEEDQPA